MSTSANVRLVVDEDSTPLVGFTVVVVDTSALFSSDLTKGVTGGDGRVTLHYDEDFFIDEFGPRTLEFRVLDRVHRQVHSFERKDGLGEILELGDVRLPRIEATGWLVTLGKGQPSPPVSQKNAIGLLVDNVVAWKRVADIRSIGCSSTSNWVTTRLLACPLTGSVQVTRTATGAVLEEVSLIRDENANLVWGIEQTVRLPTGDSRRGTEVAAEVLAHRRRLFPPPAPGPPVAPVAYEAMNSVPDYWIPFLPVHVPGSNRSVQLQRATMPSEIDQQPVRPRTAILREGLDSTPKAAHFINEEEVPQTGTRITVAYNRTRWRNGRAIVWLSTKRSAGRGEGSSGLAFDHLVDTPAAAQ